MTPVRLGEPLSSDVTVVLSPLPQDQPRPEPPVSAFVVAAFGGGVSVSTSVKYADEGFDRFLDGLAEDFHGWEGERVWRSRDHTFGVSATHHSGGHVRLLWTLRDSAVPPSWEFTAATVVRAGEDMRALATETGVFLTRIGLAAWG
ncbi:hypothetical protein LX16_1645 [Stackebrandtia albiflava]|uniref:Uncharacterized protein n=2 Tax=Stackebrandtia albiflava TaxID=406432 RepID=A0A562VDG3_9ACTN|nr:hypothetical protein LX16_1645 [Stackebrandtia albiflava]